MFETSKTVLLELRDILLQLPYGVYTEPCQLLSDATIGQHTRHVVEMYLVLLNGYQSGHVSYDDRPRNKKIEENVRYAAKMLHKIAHNIQQADKKLLLTHQLNGDIYTIPTSYNRELMYNLEHTIHHEALLRVAIADFTTIVLPTSFGVAPSTLKFRDQCAP
jgi:hypothetical protein